MNNHRCDCGQCWGEYGNEHATWCAIYTGASLTAAEKVKLAWVTMAIMAAVLLTVIGVFL